MIVRKQAQFMARRVNPPPQWNAKKPLQSWIFGAPAFMKEVLNRGAGRVPRFQ